MKTIPLFGLKKGEEDLSLSPSLSEMERTRSAFSPGPQVLKRRLTFPDSRLLKYDGTLLGS
ncbi:hypothetical protein OYT88_13855 [Sporolactobacillus sp. CQH2019]|uniref:hypothetical protein n=1 Tax=Sporolactobacillus sp. CQH2019 TaxID=3023512 RepID=UPI00236835D1|nr:hypothetical protein [Sporolactobacillus sp. CQH2019]MDD9149633.1 hypothetical protein [Sporolactobacillus sp. CQH2019]